MADVKQGQPPATGSDDLRAVLQTATLGHYEVLQELGAGGMATVFLAHDITLDRLVAIKVMSPALLFSGGMVERFRREARTAASLNHPNIIPIYAVGETDEILYFVMKYVAGRPLDQIIREFGPLSIEMSEAILAQVGSAIGHAHRKGVIHRDIKPANIMIDEEGWAVVTDFGIAKSTEATGLTSTGASVGTPYYMSPEQYSGVAVGPASDQYALGVVCYEMLAGRPPFGGRSLAELVKAHFVDPTPDIMSVRPHCPPALGRVVTRMLQREPGDRWLSIEEAIAELKPRSIGHDDPVRTQMVTLAKSGPRPIILPTPTSPVPLGRPSRKNATPTQPLATGPARRSLAPILAAIAAVLAGAVLVINLRRPSPKQSDVPTPAPASVSATVAKTELQPDTAVRTPLRAAPGTVLAKGPSAKAASESKGKKEERTPPRAPTELKPQAATRVDTVPVAAPPPPPPPIVRQEAWVKLGSKQEAAVVYINGAPQLPRNPSLRWWRVPLGPVALAVKAEGCRAWQDTRTFAAGDSIQIGYRFPICGVERDSARADTTSKE